MRHKPDLRFPLLGWLGSLMVLVAGVAGVAVVSNSQTCYTNCPFTIPPPTAQYTFSCLGTVCLFSLVSAQTSAGTTYYEGLGLPAGVVNGTPQSSSSAFEALVANGFTRQGCFDTFSSPALFQIHYAPGCGPGTASASLFGYADFQHLGASSALNTTSFPSPNGQVAYGIGGVGDLLFFQPSAGNLPFPPPSPLSNPVITNRYATFTFNIDGTIGNLSSTNAQNPAGYLLGYAGGPCPMGNCSQAYGIKWIIHQHDNGFFTDRVPVSIPYVDGSPLLVQFVLAAASATVGDPTKGASYSAAVYSDISSTAKLVGIQVFQGTPANPGPEITDFKVLSMSGTQYGKRGSSLPVTPQWSASRLRPAAATIRSLLQRTALPEGIRLWTSSMSWSITTWTDARRATLPTLIRPTRFTWWRITVMQAKCPAA